MHAFRGPDGGHAGRSWSPAMSVAQPAPSTDPVAVIAEGVTSVFSVRSRPTRVITLIAAIAMLSMADLYITLLYLHSGGMGEANPLARWLIGFNVPAVLVVWKIATVIIAGSILFCYRRERLGELGAWACCLILVWLTLRWDTYHSEVPELTASLNALDTHGSERWVRMGE